MTHARLNPGKDAAPVRHHEPPDRELDRRARGVLSTWKMRQGRGGYASRSIGNTAQGILTPTRKLGRDLRAAIDRDVPLHRVFAFGFMWLDYTRDYALNTKRYGARAMR